MSFIIFPRIKTLNKHTFSEQIAQTIPRFYCRKVSGTIRDFRFFDLNLISPVLHSRNQMTSNENAVLQFRVLLLQVCEDVLFISQFFDI
jgi:hypothetical protein